MKIKVSVLRKMIREALEEILATRHGIGPVDFSPKTMRGLGGGEEAPKTRMGLGDEMEAPRTVRGVAPAPVTGDTIPGEETDSWEMDSWIDVEDDETAPNTQRSPGVYEMKLGLGSNPAGMSAFLTDEDKELISFERDWEDDELDALELATDREMEPDMMLIPDRRKKVRQ